MAINRVQKNQKFYYDFLEAQDLKDFLKKAFDFDRNIMKGVSLFLEVEANLEMKSELIKFKKKVSHEIDSGSLNQIQHVYWPLIYTALTPFNCFLSLKAIEEKCLLNQAVIKRELEHMIQSGIVEKNDREEYRSLSEHVSIGSLANSSIYQDLFVKSLSRARSQALKNFDSAEKLFFNSYFTIKTSDLDQFTTRLQELLGEFCSDAINDDGDKVLTVVASAF